MNDKIKIDDLPPEYQELVRKATETVMEKVKNGTPFALALFDPEIIKMVTGGRKFGGRTVTIWRLFRRTKKGRRATSEPERNGKKTANCPLQSG